MTQVSLIVAHDEGGVIAAGGRIPWDLPEERAYFRRVTLGHVVVMGRITRATLPAPLDGRCNVVLSTTLAECPGCIIAPTFSQALAVGEDLDEPETFIIGGESVYAEALRMGVVSRVYATEVHARYDGDRVRRFAMPAGWRCVEEGVRREATTTRPAWTPRVWRRA